MNGEVGFVGSDRGAASRDQEIAIRIAAAQKTLYFEAVTLRPDHGAAVVMWIITWPLL